MFIINYIVAFTFLLTMIFQVSKLFTYADQAKENEVKDFVTLTKTLHNNNDGNISINMALFLSCVVLLLSFFCLKFKVQYHESLYRKKSYLCFIYLNKKTSDYVKRMGAFNNALILSYAAQFTGVGTAQAQVAHKALTHSRNVMHLKYLSELIKNPYCSSKSLAGIKYLRSIPYETTSNFLLKTNLDQTTSLRTNEWTVKIHQPRGNYIRKKNTFCLMAHFQLKNRFSITLQTKTEEAPREDLLNLKCSLG